MAEVTGIGSTDPENVGGSNADVLKALQGSAGLMDYFEKSLAIQKEIVEILRPLKDQQLTSGVGNMSIDAIRANTMALNELNDSINTAKLDVTVNGSKSNFFEQLLTASSSNTKIKGLRALSDVFEHTVMTMYRMSNYTDAIDKLARSLLGVFGTVKEFGKGLMFFSAGLALLGFTLITFMEAITYEDLIKFGVIMLMIRAASELVGKGSWDLAKVSVGIATLGLAVWAFTELIDDQMALSFIKSITLIGAGLGILTLISNGVGKNTMGLIRGSASIVAIAGSVWLLNKAVSDFDQVDLEKVASMAIVAAGLGVVWFGLGTFMSLILQGSIAAAAIGGSLWLLAAGVNSMATIDISLERGLEIAAIIVGAAGVLALIGNPFTLAFTLAGAVAAAAIGLALIALSAGMYAVSKTSVTEKQAMTFGQSAGYIVDALSSLGNPLKLPFVLAGMAQAGAIAISTFALSTAMNVIANTKVVSKERYDQFSYGVTELTDLYSNIGGPIKLLKITAGAGIMTMIAGASVITASAIWAFTKISANPMAVEQATVSLDKFITGVSTTFENNKSSFKSIKKGVGSFFGLGSMVKEIADSVQAISNLEFIEKEVRDGKVVVTGVRKFTPEDFANVGSSIGMILSALTDPLTQIASSKDSFSIGGFKITNPFSNKVQKGIKSMMNIGSIFIPLSGILSTFVEHGIDTPKVNQFNQNLASILGGIGHAFSMKNVNIDDDMIKIIMSATTAVDKIMKSTMHEKFEAGTKNFKQFSTDLATVKNSMNGIDLKKLTEFNSMLFNLNELAKGDSLDDLVDIFKEFFEKLIDLESSRNQSSTTIVQQSATTGSPVGPQIVQQEPSLSAEKMQEFMQLANEDVVDAIQQLYEFIVSGNVRVTAKLQDRL